MIRRTLQSLCLALLATGCAWISPREAAPPLPPKGPVSAATLLAEMADMGNLARFPDPPYSCLQASSYDRHSTAANVSDNSWFANDDRAKFIRVEEHDGHKEYVMMDAEGPGAVVRIWSANAQGNIRFYFNGEATPSFKADMKDFLGGKHPLFPEPLSHGAAMGWNIYFPFAYSKSLKITTDASMTFYYQVNYRTYPKGTPVEDFSAQAAETLKPEIAKTIAAMNAGASGVAELKAAPHEPIEPGERKLLASASRGPAQIDLLALHLESGDPVAALRGTLIEIRCDGEAAPTVIAPIGDFFGASPGINPYQSLPLGVLESGVMYSRWAMPFQKKIEVFAVNKSAAPVGVAIDLRRGALPGGWTDRTMHFHAGYRGEFGMPTRPFRDWNFVEAKGKGVFVGDSLAIVNPSKAWWGEGDEKIYFDGQTFPSHFGTGTEDYYGYAWCSPTKFYHPYHNQPRCDGPGNYGYTSVNRYHIIDAIPFERDFKFDMEVWHSQGNVTVGYAATSYWYAAPGSSSNLGEPAEAELRVPPLEPITKFKVEGAIEAEDLNFKAEDGTASMQDLSSFSGKWSGDEQIWFRGAKPGSRLEIALDAPGAGKYEVRANFTKASDYGIAKVTINGAVAKESLDFHNSIVAPTKEISLGVHDLKEKGNAVVLEVVGANEKAGNSYMLGVDYFKLVPKN